MRPVFENQTNLPYHYSRESSRVMRARSYKAEIKKELRLGRTGDETFFKAILDYIRVTRDGQAAREWKSPVELATLERRAAEKVKKEVEEEIELAALEEKVSHRSKRSPKAELDKGLTNCLQWGMRRSTESFFGVQPAPQQLNREPQYVSWMNGQGGFQPMTAATGGQFHYAQNTMVHQMAQSQMTSFSQPSWISSQAGMGQSPEIIWDSTPVLNMKTIPLVKLEEEETTGLEDISACKNPVAAETISFPPGWPSPLPIEYSTFADIDTTGMDGNLDVIEPFNLEALPVA